MADTKPVEVLGAIGGDSFLAIDAEMETVRRYGLDLARYRILIAQDRISEIVVFLARDREQAPAGDIGIRRGLGTMVNAEEMLLIQAAAGASEGSPENARVQVLDSIQGGCFLAIRAAMPVFRQRASPDHLVQYRIGVVRDNDTVVAVFTDKAREPTSRGSQGGRPGFEVAMDPSDLRVLRANFVK